MQRFQEDRESRQIAREATEHRDTDQKAKMHGRDEGGDHECGEPCYQRDIGQHHGQAHTAVSMTQRRADTFARTEFLLKTVKIMDAKVSGEAHRDTG